MNAKLYHSSEGKQLIEDLECLVKEKAQETGHKKGVFNIVSLLQECGVLNDCKSRFMLDISGNGQFVSELLQSGACYNEQCVSLMCLNCEVHCNDVVRRKVVAKSCLGYDTSEIEKLRHFRCDEINEDVLAASTGQGGKDEETNNVATSGVQRTSKAMRIILGSVFNTCQSADQDNELSCRAKLLNQCITALRLLHQGDYFICELSDTLTQFTAGITYILNLLFKEMALISPIFCPVSKQFLVCRNFVNSVQFSAIIAYMERLSEVFIINKPLEKGIISFLPISELFSEEFYKYIRTQSTNHVKQQLNWIVKCERVFLSKNHSE